LAFSSYARRLSARYAPSGKSSAYSSTFAEPFISERWLIEPSNSTHLLLTALLRR
jgi:hypothetical protein